MKTICVTASRRLGGIVAGAAVLFFPISSDAQEGARYLNGAFSGEAAPGGGLYRFFDEVVIGGEREVVFRGEVSLDTAASDPERVWGGTLTSNSVLARALTPAPGTPGQFLSFSRLAVNSSGQAAFLARTSEMSSERFVFAQDASGVVLGLSDQTSPFAAGGLQFDDAGNPGYSTGGVLAVKARLTDPGNAQSFSSAVLMGTPGNLNYVLTEGDSVPDAGRFPAKTVVGSLFGNSADSFSSRERIWQ